MRGLCLEAQQVTANNMLTRSQFDSIRNITNILHVKLNARYLFLSTTRYRLSVAICWEFVRHSCAIVFTQSYLHRRAITHGNIHKQIVISAVHNLDP